MSDLASTCCNTQNSLLDLTTTNTCLLFEQSNYDKFQPDIFLSGNHNEEL